MGHVAAVGVFALGDIFKTRPIAPRAIMPIEFRPSITARAGGRKRGFVMKHPAIVAAPGAGDHKFRNRTGTLCALERRFQLAAKLPLKLLLTYILPITPGGTLCFFRT